VRLVLRATGLIATALAVAAMVATAAAVFVLHLAIQPVLSGSMRPTFSPGALVITRSIPTSSIRPGDIILFIPPGDTSQYAHRVTSVSGAADRPVITTKGDANPAPDGWHAQIVASSVPQVVGSIPGLGRIIVAVEQSGARLFLLAAAGLVFSVLGTKSILGSAPTCEPSREVVTST
jgi:signal peptidase I